MKIPQVNRYHLLSFLLFFCSMLLRMNTKTLEAAAVARNKFAQATIPTTPIASDSEYCKSHWLFDRYPTAAAVLGMAHEELWVALHDDKSIADFARTRQVDLQVVIDTLVNAESVHIDELLQAACFSPTAAELKRSTLVRNVTTFVHDQTAPAFLMCRIGWAAYDELAANILGTDLTALHTALIEGSTLISLGAEHGFDRQALIDALIQAKLAIIQELVDTHCVAASDGALWNKLIPIEVTDFVDNSPKLKTMKYWSEIFQLQQSTLFLPVLMK